MRTQFEFTKKQQENLKNEQNRDSLLRRPNRGSSNAVRKRERNKKRTDIANFYISKPEHPYQPLSRDEFALREQAFVNNTDSQLDDFIEQAQNLLENLTDQHNILKVKANISNKARLLTLEIENAKESLGCSKLFRTISECNTIH